MSRREIDIFEVPVTIRGGAKVKLPAYESDGKTILLEAGVMNLLEKMNYGPPTIDWMEAVPCSCMKSRIRDIGKGDEITRYVVQATVHVPGEKGDGWKYSALGSAGADSIDSPGIRPYAPEMAEKRARVRAAIRALGLWGYNADVEMPDFDGSPFDDESPTSGAKRRKKKKRTSKKSGARKIIPEQKKAILEELEDAGIRNQQGLNAFAKVQLGLRNIKALSTISFKQASEILSNLDPMIKSFLKKVEEHEEEK